MIGMTEEGRLKRSLSPAETWSFGATILLFWAYAAQSALVALGPVSLALWAAVAAVTATMNLQVRRLAMAWPDVVGGSPSYLSRLWADRPLVGRYAAMAYFAAWATIPPIAADFLADFIGDRFPAVATGPANLALIIGFTLVPFVVAWSGVRALALLQLIYIIPTVGILIAFVASGLGWLVFAPDSPGLAPVGGAVMPEPLTVVQWLFFLTFSAYGAETASVFVAESHNPRATIRNLVVLAITVVPIFVGASYVLLQASPAVPDPDVHRGFLDASARFWGEAAPFIGSVFLAGVALLGASAAVAVAPRVLYQQARDGHLPSVFGMASDRGVPGPALLATLLVGIAFSIPLDLEDGIIASATCWFGFWILMHAGLWHGRGRPEVLWSRLALALAVIETAVFVVGGVTLGAASFGLGLLLPALVIVAAGVVGRLADRGGLRVLRPEWWQERYRPRPLGASDGAVTRQVLTVIVLVTAAIGASWILSTLAQQDPDPDATDVLLAITLFVGGFFAIAFAGSTTLANLAALGAARSRAEQSAAALEVEKRAEVAANEELERINRAQRDFVSIVSHEFRTPLTGIQGFAEIIRDEDISIAETKEFADDIHRDAVRLARMIGEILDLERMRSGRMTLIRVPVDLPALIREVADRVGARTLDHPIELRLSPTPTIQGDADKLTQVLTNLLSNAIKYSPHGGPITVSCGVDHNGVALAVIDHGIGIPEDQLDSVFDPYTRVEASATKDVQGTGLGLPIVREIVRLHGGRVWAEPVPGGGSAFRVRLPLPAGASADGGGPDPAVPVPAP